MLQFCVSQQHNETPFIFKSTGVHVYSLEEALYHVFHYWRESVDDFLSDNMIVWLSDIGLSSIASQLTEIVAETHFPTQVLSFLQVIKYFSAEELGNLKPDLLAWETRREWERLKERADNLVNRGEPSKALPLYKRALRLEENAELLNNIGVVCMQLSSVKEAASYLSRARALQPENVQVLLNYTEAAILSRQYDNAVLALTKAEAISPGSAAIPFLRGLMAHEQKNYSQALSFYESATELASTEQYYIYKIADVHKTMRRYESALNALEAISDKSADYYVVEAEIHAAAGDVPASLRCMRKATEVGGTNDANLWAKLAEYYRRDYDWRRAEKAIDHAKSLAPDNDRVRMESARIKKGLGRTRDYQAEMADILKSFKERYRTDG